MIPFKNIPAGTRTPLFYAEIDASQANTAAQTQRTLLIGQATPAGVGPVNLPVRCMGVADANAFAGNGSMLAAMAAAYRANDPDGELWILPIADDPAAVAAAGTLTFSGTTTVVGTLSLYVAGTLVALTIAAGQTGAQVAAVVAAALAADSDLPVTAAVAGAVVTLTARNAGPAGNDIDVRANYRDRSGGESLPPGLGLAIAPFTGGAGEPLVSTALANLQDPTFDFIVCGLTYNAPAVLKPFMNDATGRWSWQQQAFGHVFYAARGSAGALANTGTNMNDPHASLIGFAGSPSPAWCWAAAVAGALAPSLRTDPGQPLQTLPVAGVLAPTLASRFSQTVRNMLLYAGCSTFTVAVDGTVAIENIITTYVTNSAGEADDSYLQIETLFLLAFVLRRLRAVVQTKFARVKLAADGTRLIGASNVVTPSVIRAELIAQYRQLEAEGMVQQADVFAQGLVVQKNASSPNRVDVLLPAILIDQLRVFAALVQFRLS